MDRYDMEFNRTVTPGGLPGRNGEERTSISLVNRKTGVRRTIVDETGSIVCFPGLAHPKLIRLYCRHCPTEKIRYRSCVSLLGEQYALIWCVQPDGRYWEDEDGFGGTSDPEVNLYARMDGSGRFIEKFRIYSVGGTDFYGTDMEERLIRRLASRKDPLYNLQKHLPQMLHEIEQALETGGTGNSWYDIPGTIYQAGLSLEQGREGPFLSVYMRKEGSYASYSGSLELPPGAPPNAQLSSDQVKEKAEKMLTQLFLCVKKAENEE